MKGRNLIVFCTKKTISIRAVGYSGTDGQGEVQNRENLNTGISSSTVVFLLN